MEHLARRLRFQRLRLRPVRAEETLDLTVIDRPATAREPAPDHSSS
jgi:hypothetical protein